MKNNSEEYLMRSYRVGKTANTRLIKSSQIPKDFFSGQQSAKALPKTRCS